MHSLEAKRTLVLDTHQESSVGFITILDPKTRIFVKLYSCLYKTTTIPFLITIGDSFQHNGLDGARLMVEAVGEDNETAGGSPGRHICRHYFENLKNMF